MLQADLVGMTSTKVHILGITIRRHNNIHIISIHSCAADMFHYLLARLLAFMIFRCSLAHFQPSFDKSGAFTCRAQHNDLTRDGKGSQPPVNVYIAVENHHLQWVNQLFRLGHVQQQSVSHYQKVSRKWMEMVSETSQEPFEVGVGMRSPWISQLQRW